MIEFLWLLFSYLFASIPNGYLITKWVSGKDIRKIDKEKLSASNIMQNIGYIPGIFSGAFDVLKGVIAVFGAQMLDLSLIFQALAGIFALCGQMWPIFFNFWGGRGGAVCIGSLLLLTLKSPQIFIIPAIIWILAKLISFEYGAPIGMTLFLLISAILSGIYQMNEVLIFSSLAFILVLIQRVLGKPGSITKINKKVLFYRFFLDRDTKERFPKK